MASESSQVVTTPSLRVARHIVAILVLMFFMPPMPGNSKLFDWLVSFVGAGVCAGFLAGLAALLRPKTQAKKALHNFIVAYWVLAAVLMLGRWQLWWQGRPAAARATAAQGEAMRAIPAEPAPSSAAVDGRGPWTKYQQAPVDSLR